MCGCAKKMTTRNYWKKRKGLVRQKKKEFTEYKTSPLIQTNLPHIWKFQSLSNFRVSCLDVNNYKPLKSIIRLLMTQDEVSSRIVSPSHNFSCDCWANSQVKHPAIVGWPIPLAGQERLLQRANDREIDPALLSSVAALSPAVLGTRWANKTSKFHVPSPFEKLNFEFFCVVWYWFSKKYCFWFEALKKVFEIE